MVSKPLNYTKKFQRQLTRELKAKLRKENKLHQYKIEGMNYEVTGFATLAEWAAYEMGREHEQSIIMEWIDNWDGKENSAMGTLLMKKFVNLRIGR